MENIYSRIRKRREELGLSQEELAKRMGYKSKSSINKIEMGINDIPQSKVVAFAQALNTTTAYLMGNDTDQKPNKPVFDNLFPIELKKYRLLGEIACGEPIFCNEDRESYIMSGTQIDADFCLRCKGDSMINARIYDGDIVFIREQSQVENGDIAAVIIDDEATLKRVYYYPEQNIVILKPENPKYADIILQNKTLNTVRILGKAIAFQSDVK